MDGGLLRGGLYLIQGGPGTGKTVLGNHICFNRAAAGERCIYITLLMESQARMLENLQSFSFFDSALIPHPLTYLNGFTALEKEGLKGLLRLIQRAIRAQKAQVLVIDAGTTLTETEDARLSGKRFLRELGTFCLLTGTTCLLLTHLPEAGHSSEENLADGILLLCREVRGLRDARKLEVCKYRGSSHLGGRHHFVISSEGISVHPRTESLIEEAPSWPLEDRSRVPLGVSGLDEMLHGGVLSASTTALLGAPGAGKTLLGLQFLAASARAGEPALYFGFYEPPPRLISKAISIGLPLDSYVESGLLELVWRPEVEHQLDVLAEQLFAAVYQRKVRRLFIDGIDGFQQGAFSPERITLFFAAISTRLRALGVTTLVSEESRFFGPNLELPEMSLSASCENIISLRYVELRSQLYRLLSILKMRESDFDTSLRHFRITSAGIVVGDSFERAKVLRRKERPQRRASGTHPRPSSRKRSKP